MVSVWTFSVSISFNYVVQSESAIVIKYCIHLKHLLIQIALFLDVTYIISIN